MNVHVATRELERNVAAESAEPGPVPHRWTFRDVLTMVETGLLQVEHGVELIDGVIYDMPADGPRTVSWSVAINRWLMWSLSAEYAVVPDKSAVLSDYDAPVPDWWVFPDGRDIESLSGPDLLLVVEQSDTTLNRDLGLKAALYARFGVRDYWVIDIANRQVHLHRDPTPDGYATTPPPFGRDDPVEALLIPGLTLRLADLTRVGGAGAIG